MTFGESHGGEQRDSPGDDNGNVTPGLEPSQRGSNEHSESSSCIDLVYLVGVLWWLSCIMTLMSASRNKLLPLAFTDSCFSFDTAQNLLLIPAICQRSSAVCCPLKTSPCSLWLPESSILLKYKHNLKKIM